MITELNFRSLLPVYLPYQPASNLWNASAGVFTATLPHRSGVSVLSIVNISRSPAVPATYSQPHEREEPASRRKRWKCGCARKGRKFYVQATLRDFPGWAYRPNYWRSKANADYCMDYFRAEPPWQKEGHA